DTIRRQTRRRRRDTIAPGGGWIGRPTLGGAHAVGRVARRARLGRPGRVPRRIKRLVYVPSMERKWWTLLAVCVAIFMLLLDITIVNVSLPAIERSLNASFSDLQWVVDAYALALATCTLTAGSVADLFGRKR